MCFDITESEYITDMNEKLKKRDNLLGHWIAVGAYFVMLGMTSWLLVGAVAWLRGLRGECAAGDDDQFWRNFAWLCVALNIYLWVDVYLIAEHEKERAITQAKLDLLVLNGRRESKTVVPRSCSCNDLDLRRMRALSAELGEILLTRRSTRDRNE